MTVRGVSEDVTAMLRKVIAGNLKAFEVARKLHAPAEYVVTRAKLLEHNGTAHYRPIRRKSKSKPKVA